MRIRFIITTAWLVLATALGPPAWAWGPEGHHTVGAMADRLLAGTVAEQQVRVLLGGMSLEQASVWADCVKGVRPGTGFDYPESGKYPECAPFETDAGRAAMGDYVRRNDSNCDREPTEESCHRQYHYADVAIQHNRYATGFTGARRDDVVAAIAAAVHVLKNEPAAPPFSFADKREALLVLAHLVGDIHQPLHVGAVYLSVRGTRVDPDADTLDPETETRGGNRLWLGGPGTANLHSRWDAVPTSLTVALLTDMLIQQARAVPVTPGLAADWSTAWATDTVRIARQAFVGVRFGAKKAGRWPTKLPTGYAARINALKREQVVKAGAHLAQLLQAVWP